MVNTSTATTNFNQQVQTLINKRLEELMRAPKPHLLPGNFLPATHKPGSNATMRFLNIPDVTVNDAELAASIVQVEGVPNAAAALAFGYEEFTTRQRMKTLGFTDVALLESPLRLMAEGADRLAEYVMALADRVAANKIVTGVNVIYAGAGKTSTAGLAAGDVLTGALSKKAVALLEAGSVPTFPDGFYRGIIHPYAKYDLMSDTAVGGWIDANRYAGSQALFAGELGSYGSVRYISSPNAAVKVDAGTTQSGGNVTGVATTNVITTAAAHGFAVGDRVRFPTLTGGTGLTAATQIYFIIAGSLTATTFKVSLTSGGAEVDFTSDITAGTVGKVINVYSTTIFGPRFFAVGDFGNNETFVTPPGGHDDPGRQSALITWKGWMDAVIIGEGANATNVSPPRYIRVESVASI